MTSSVKRSSLTPFDPDPEFSSKRFKRENSPPVHKPPQQNGTGSTHVSTFPAERTKITTRGVEQVAYPVDSSLNEDINNVIIATVRTLAHAGKRLNGAPRLSPSEIQFSWVLDFSARNEDIVSLLNIDGIDLAALRMVLRRVNMPSSDPGSSRFMPPIVSENKSSLTSQTSPKQHDSSLNGFGIDALHPICVDSDPEEPSSQDVCMERYQAATTSMPVADISTHSDTRHPQGLEIEHAYTTSEYAVTDDNPSNPNHNDDVGFHPEVEGNLVTAYQRLSAADEQGAASSSDIFSRRCSDQVISGKSAASCPESLYGDFDMLNSSDNEELSDEDDNASREPSHHQSRPPRQGREYRLSSIEYIEPDETEASRLLLDSTQQKGRPPSFSFLSSSDDEHDERIRPEPGPSSRSMRPTLRRQRMSNEPASNSAKVFPENIARRHGTRSSNSSSYDASRRSSSLRGHPVNPPRYTESQTVHAEIVEVIIPRTNYARGRRLLIPRNPALPLVTIAMRGDASFIDQHRLFRITRFSLPFYRKDGSLESRVVDACLLGDNAAVLAYDQGPCQVSVISLAVHQKPRRIDIAHRAHSMVQERRTLGTSGPNPGVSTLAPVGDSRFLSGGHDKSIHVWKLHCDDDGNYTACSQRLNFTHAQTVQSIAFREYDQTVISCAGRNIAEVSLLGGNMPDPIRVSDGRILQVHVHPQDPQVVVLEVDHMDRQVLVYDTRKAGFNRSPCITFGCRESSVQKSTRYIKGSTWASHFVRPYGIGEKGAVRMWDYRNSKEVLSSFYAERQAPIVHAVLDGTNIVAYGEYTVTSWRTNSGGS